jgi:hypothetical protein
MNEPRIRYRPLDVRDAVKVDRGLLYPDDATITPTSPIYRVSHRRSIPAQKRPPCAYVRSVLRIIDANLALQRSELTSRGAWRHDRELSNAPQPPADLLEEVRLRERENSWMGGKHELHKRRTGTRAPHDERPTEVLRLIVGRCKSR